MCELEATADVIKALEEFGAKRIGVDGIDGAGKSRFAAELANELSVPYLCLDDFLVALRGSFVDFVKYDRLRAAVASHRAFVIEGVCLLDVLVKAEVTIDALVYVKRCHLGDWSDERELDLSEPLEDFLVREREMVARIAKKPTIDHLGLSEEIIRYHYHRRPHRRANVIYRRNDG